MQDKERSFDFQGNIDCEGTDKVVCPYCGYIMDDDEYSVNDSGTEWECRDCGKVFYVSTFTTRTYYSNKIAESEGK